MSRLDVYRPGQEAQSRAIEGLATFSVRATFAGRGSEEKQLKGEPFISQDAIVFMTRGLGEPTRLDHGERDITLVTGRLCPPWANTFLFLRDKASTARIAAPMPARRSLRRALRKTGVTVHEQGSWRAPELPRRGGRRT